MALMRAALGAVHFRAHHEKGAVGVGRRRAFDRRPEAWPAGAAFELGLHLVGRRAAGGADEGALSLLMQQRRGAGPLGRMLEHDRELLGTQLLAPVLVALDHVVTLGGCGVALAEQFHIEASVEVTPARRTGMPGTGRTAPPGCLCRAWHRYSCGGS